MGSWIMPTTDFVITFNYRLMEVNSILVRLQFDVPLAIERPTRDNRLARLTARPVPPHVRFFRRSYDAKTREPKLYEIIPRTSIR